MARSGDTPRRPRRTQEERRAATRAALLDATIECLIAYGYAGVTTSRVVERAGVSRGAQVHHFPTKAQLVGEAVIHLLERLYAELAKDLRQTPSGAKRIDLVLDLAWRIHTGPLFKAGLELWVAARTDPELHAQILSVHEDASKAVADGIAEFFPDYARSAEFRGAMRFALATVRGVAMAAIVAEEVTDVDRLWVDARRRLKRMLIASSAASAKPRKRRAA